MPCCDVMLTIRPRASPTGSCVSIWRTAARHSRYGPRRLTAIIASQSSGSVSSSAFEWSPASTALLTSRSSEPVRSTAAATSASQAAGSETSASTCTALPPAARITSSVGSPPVIGSRRMSAASTSNPSAARRIAIARPMPDAAPVTMALRRLIRTPLLFVDCRNARRRVRRPLPAQPELEDRRRRPLPGRLLAAGRGDPRPRLAARADALPRAGLHRPQPLLGGQGAARHRRLPAPLPAARRGRRRRRRGARCPR